MDVVHVDQIQLERPQRLAHAVPGGPVGAPPARRAPRSRQPEERVAAVPGEDSTRWPLPAQQGRGLFRDDFLAAADAVYYALEEPSGSNPQGERDARRLAPYTAPIRAKWDSTRYRQ